MREQLQPKSLAAAASLDAIGKCQFFLKCFQNAKQSFETARQIRSQLLSQTHIDLASSALHLAVIDLKAKRFEDAMSQLTKAKGIFEEYIPYQHEKEFEQKLKGIESISVQLRVSEFEDEKIDALIDTVLAIPSKSVYLI